MKRSSANGKNSDATIGVLDYNAPVRSVMDQKMQNTYGIGTRELYSSENEGVTGQDFGVRTKKDMMLQAEFNPYYKGNGESFQFRNVKRMSEARRYARDIQEGFYSGSCPYASTTDNPYNPIPSSMVKFEPLK